MGRPVAFARANAMLAVIRQALLLPVGFAQHAALDEIGAYVSRGKGRGGVFLGSSSRCVAQDKRDAVKARNRLRHKRRCHGYSTVFLLVVLIVSAMCVEAIVELFVMALRVTT
jgi:hypothetical protein